ncbi:TPA: DNA methyltransferase, partial [Clostridioides difficile]
MKKNIPRTTKLNSSQQRNTLYKYYAGYSEGFVEDIIQLLSLKRADLILDPWNGSGTTTYVASKKGISSIGVDINPIMSIIANARLFHKSQEEYEIGSILKLSRRYRFKVEESDSLCNWFSLDTVNILRKIEKAVFNGMFLKEIINQNVNYSKLQSFYCVVFFNVVKILASSFKSSNPTWPKKPPINEKKAYSRDEIEWVFKNEFNNMIQAVENTNLTTEVSTNIIIGQSENLPIQKATVDVVITSPPYCTRIDYAVMTSLELAVLNINEKEFNELRHSLIGAPVIHKDQPEVLEQWGETCINTLLKIKEHSSKASQSYYLKTYLQYFNSMYLSLREIDRALKNNGRCVLV